MRIKGRDKEEREKKMGKQAWGRERSNERTQGTRMGQTNRRYNGH